MSYGGCISKGQVGLANGLFVGGSKLTFILNSSVMKRSLRRKAIMTLGAEGAGDEEVTGLRKNKPWWFDVPVLRRQ